MMKKNYLAMLVVFLFLFQGELQAQEVIPATGGSVTSTGGSLSYTVGQVFYTTITGADGTSVIQGVQQPVEIQDITGISEENEIYLDVSLYPNPITSILTLKIKKPDMNILYYQILDMNGKLILLKKITEEETLINVNDLAPGNYFINIFNEEKLVKTFKVIKN